MSNNGGYVLFDCMGLDLSSASEQKKDGIHAAALRAISLHKPIYAINCNYDGAEFSAVPVTVHMSGTTELPARTCCRFSSLTRTFAPFQIL